MAYAILVLGVDGGICHMLIMKVPGFSDKEKVLRILEVTGTSKAALGRALEVHYTTLLRWLREKGTATFFIYDRKPKGQPSKLETNQLTKS